MCQKPLKPVLLAIPFKRLKKKNLKNLENLPFFLLFFFQESPAKALNR